MGFEINRTKVSIIYQTPLPKLSETKTKQRSEISGATRIDTSPFEDKKNISVELGLSKNNIQEIVTDDENEIKQRTKENPIMTLLQTLMSTIKSYIL